MIDLKDFSTLQKTSKQSFQQQKLMIKKLMSGQQVLCPQCKQPIKLNLPVNAQSANKKQPSSILCAKGCTDIELDFVL